MLPATTLKPTFTGPRVALVQRSRVAASRATVRVRAGPYDEELIATAVRSPPSRQQQR
jgi:hypothetical protein